jgi:NADH-quinone oxidoreductase E subunit
MSLTLMGKAESVGSWEDSIQKILVQHAGKRTALLPCLEKIQEFSGCVTPESVAYLRKALDIPAAAIYGVASFYGMFTTTQKGKYVITVCDSLSCHINRSQDLIKNIAEILNIKPGETTPDGKFTLEVVDCLGLCDQSPAMIINQTVYGKLDHSALSNILDKLRNED